MQSMMSFVVIQRPIGRDKISVWVEEYKKLTFQILGLVTYLASQSRLSLGQDSKISRAFDVQL